MYLHDAASLQKLWDEIGEATGTKWVVETRLGEAEIFCIYAKSGQGCAEDFVCC